MLFCGGEFKGAPADLAEQHLTAPAREALADFAQRAQDADWSREALSALIKAVLADRGMKMPQLAILASVAVTGQTQTPRSTPCWPCWAKQTVPQAPGGDLGKRDVRMRDCATLACVIARRSYARFVGWVERESS